MASIFSDKVNLGDKGGFLKQTMVATQNLSDFKTLFEERLKNFNLEEGKLINGTVVSVGRDMVAVDIGFKSEGYIPVEEFINFDGVVPIKPGDSIKVVLEQIEDDNGQLILSKERADALEAWDNVAEAFEKDAAIDGVIVNKIKGGMSVNLGGIKAFLPGSQIDLKPIKSLDRLIGHKYQFKIIKLNKAKGNIVLSRRVVLEKERESQKKQLLENLREGQVVKGVVKNLTEYGAFVDLGGIDGLLHITDMSWGRAGHPNEIFSVGDEIDVVVLKYDPKTEKVSLGYKQLKPDPWKEVREKYIPGEKLQGKVVNITDYGIFVELAEGIEGLVHISELSWSKKMKHPSKMVKQGDIIEAVVLDVDPDNRRISLGTKQLEPNPWDGLVGKYPAGTVVQGTVRNITDFGVFVGIEGEEIDGLVHVSDLTWEKNGKHPSELFKKGDTVSAIVLTVDKANERFALGIKQLSDDPRANIARKYKTGAVISGVVGQVTDRGIFVTLEDDIPGFIANSELSLHGKDTGAERPKEGDPVTAVVKKLDSKDNRVLLSVKAHEKALEKEHMKEFLSQQGDSSVKLQDIAK
ncbi:MAG: 30S ribosomal protein S1 [Deltaproteobacteria bacterium]|nr:30S ribosomal protein S1 [Deltaproteobacteria bacterium]